jgi:hydroxymethylpyrimidine pyrophosphatase-like HAD family hydrolase
VPHFHYHRNTVYVRFCHAGYSKGSALGELQRLLGIPPGQTFAAGDHLNDIPMLDGKYARMTACPGNSVDDVKSVVRSAGGFVATGKCSSGVVEALKHFLTKTAPCHKTGDA